MTDIFISYKNEDSDRVRNIADALSQLGYDVWWDQRIPLGQTYRSAIGDVLSTAKCVIVVWSYHAVEAQWVLDEADEGKTRGVLLPILIDPVDPPFGFRQIETARLIDWVGEPDHQEWQDVIEAVADFVGQKDRPHGEAASQDEPTSTICPEPVEADDATAERRAAIAKDRPPKRRGPGVLIFIAIIFILLGVGGWWGGSQLETVFVAKTEAESQLHEVGIVSPIQRPALVRVHISAESQRDQADALVVALETVGYTVRGADIVGENAPRTAEIRGYQAASHSYLRQIEADLAAAGITGFTTRILPAGDAQAAETLDIYFPVIAR